MEIVRSRAGPQGDSCRQGQGQGQGQGRQGRLNPPSGTLGARGWLAFRLSTKLWHLEKPWVFHVPITMHPSLGAVILEKTEGAIPETTARLFSGTLHSPAHSSTGHGCQNWFHLSWAREYSVPPAWARLSHFLCSISLCLCFLFFVFCITVIKYADKSNLRGREFISAQNLELQTITVEDVPGAGARGCWLCMLLKSFHPVHALPSLALSAHLALSLVSVLSPAFSTSLGTSLNADWSVLFLSPGAQVAPFSPTPHAFKNPALSVTDPGQPDSRRPYSP